MPLARGIIACPPVSIFVIREFAIFRIIFIIPILLDLYESVGEFGFIPGFWEVFDKFRAD